MTADAGWAPEAVAAMDHFFAIGLDLILAVDTDGTILRATDLWEKATGWSPTELCGASWRAYIHPDDLAMTDEVFAEILLGSGSISSTSRWRTRSGGYRDLEWNATLNPGSGIAYCLARDVTDANREERRHRALNQAWLAVAAEPSVDDVLTVVNEQARLLIGAHQAVTSITVGDQWEQAITAVSLDETYAQWRSYDARTDGSGIYAEVLRRNAPMRMTQQELAAHPLFRGFGAAAAEHPPMRGWLAVPMGGRSSTPLGMIQLSDKIDGSEFDEADEESLVEFSRVAALTIERARAEITATEALEQLEEMLDSISDAFVAFDYDWRITFINPAARRFVKVPGDARGLTIWEAFPQAAQDRFLPHLSEAMAGRSATMFRSHNAVTGTWYEIRTSPFRTGLAVYFIDVTEQEAATDDLERRVAMQAVVADLGQAALTGLDATTLMRETVVRVAEVLRVTNVGAMQLVDGGRRVRVRAAVNRTDGNEPAVATSDEGIEFDIATLGAAAVRQALDSFDWAVVDVANSPDIAGDFGVVSSIAVPIGRRDAVWGVLGLGHNLPDRFGIREGVFLAQVAHILSSAIERHESETAVRHQATHDALTGLPNRQLLRDRMDATLGRVTEDGPGASLLLLDLDGFKDVNDSLGHATGDLVLQQVADRLSALLEQGSMVARLGGDEFAVLVEGDADDDAAAQLAQLIVTAIAVPFSLPELDVPLSTSVGVVRAPTHGTDASTLLRRADVAMYRAKAQSLGWAMYDNDLDAARADRLNTIAELRRGIAENELELHYQPIVDIDTGAVSSLEALVRWRHPRQGLVPPLSFIPLAEQTGLIVPLTAWVVEEALRQARLWHDDGFLARVAVNLSVDVLTREVATDPLLARIMSAPDLVTAEITESSLADERARTAVVRLAAAGVDCAVDDFGTGYSSLAYLKDLPVAQLKIDRAFVMDVSRTDRDRAIVRSVADLGAALAMDVVAEGVEDAESVEALRACGVRLAQGYHFARPMPAAALDDWRASR